MSLLRLLATGKSLVGMKDIPSRYQMRAANLLPKFGSPKNPFAAKPEADRSAPASPPAKAEPAKMETAPLFEAKPKIAAPSPVKAKEVRPASQPPLKIEPQITTAQPAAPARPRAPLAEWAKKINPLSYLPARLPGPKKPVRTSRTPVQGELSLEKVKVVRNDLSDADVEVVPARAAGVAMTGRSIAAVDHDDGISAWDRVTSRLAGAGQTLTPQ